MSPCTGKFALPESTVSKYGKSSIFPSQWQIHFICALYEILPFFIRIKQHIKGQFYDNSTKRNNRPSKWLGPLDEISCYLFTLLTIIMEHCETSWQSGFVANMLLPLSNISGYLNGVLKILPRYILKSCHRTSEYIGIAKP